MNTNTPLKLVFMDIIPTIYFKIPTKDTDFTNHLIIVEAYSKTTKLYGMEIPPLRKSWKVRYVLGNIWKSAHWVLTQWARPQWGYAHCEKPHCGAPHCE